MVHENPNTLLKEAFAVLEQYERLIFAVNQANLRHKLPDGHTLTEAMARRDALMQKHSLLKSVLDSTKKDRYRYQASEIKWLVTVDVGQMQEQLDDVAKQIRELNARIQETNWKVELEE